MPQTEATSTGDYSNKKYKQTRLLTNLYYLNLNSFFRKFEQKFINKRSWVAPEHEPQRRHILINPEVPESDGDRTQPPTASTVLQ